jgi:hypothetical protein
MRKLITNKAAPIIFTILGSIGVVGCTVLTSIQTAKACKKLDKAEAEKGSKLTKKEVVETAASFYIPVAVADAVTIGLIVSSEVLSYKQSASLIAGCTAMGNYIREYRTKTAMHVGTEEEARINESALAHIDCDYHYLGPVAQDRVYRFRFRDDPPDRYVDATERSMIDAFYHINRNFVLRGSVGMNEIYEFVGLPPLPEKEHDGFDIESETFWIDVGWEITDETTNPPTAVIDFAWEPVDLREYE